MKERLKELIEVLRNVTLEGNLNVSNETLFIQACTYHRGEISNENFRKNKGMEAWDKAKKETKTNKASDNQLAYIQKLADKTKTEVKVSEELTSKEASKMIEELKNEVENNG